MPVESEQSEVPASSLEDDFEVQMPDSLQVSIQHNDPEDWLAELRLVVSNCGDRTVRISIHAEKRDDVSDIFVIGGYFDEMGMLSELTYRCEQVDYHGMLFEGTAEAKELVASLKASCREIAAETGVSITLLGGRFKVQ